MVSGGFSALPAIIAATALTATHVLPRDRHPAFVDIARFAPGSRRTMTQALRVIAALFDRTPETKVCDESSTGRCTRRTPCPVRIDQTEAAKAVVAASTSTGAISSW